MFVNGSTQRAYIDRDKAASPTASRNDIIITGAMEAKQGRYVMIKYVPNDFLQTPLPQDERGLDNYYEDFGSTGRYSMRYKP